MVSITKLDMLTTDTKRNEHLHPFADKLVAQIAGEPLGLGINEHDLTGGVGHDHGAWAGLNDQADNLVRSK